ncbi:hypothetical protein DSUL_20462 [Desulfovibrionales bacterium]
MACSPGGLRLNRGRRNLLYHLYITRNHCGLTIMTLKKTYSNTIIWPS